MNEELIKIRQLRGYNEVMGVKPEKIKDESMDEWVYKLNTNMAKLYSLDYSQNYDEHVFVDCIIDNIYNILNMFNEMHVYPGYFFRKVFEMNAKFIERKAEYENQEDHIRDNSKMGVDNFYIRDTNLEEWLISEVRKGFEKGYYRVQAYPKTNVNEAFLEIVGLFQKYNLPYKINSVEKCKKVYNKLHTDFTNNVNKLVNSYLVITDIACLCRMLYDYVAFFVSVGVNPRIQLNNYIEQKEQERIDTKAK